jgi:hypothetical protein
MPTLNINGNILTDTEANWTVDATVYSAKTILVSTDVQYNSTDQNKWKLANGVDTWANLDYMPIGDGAGDLLAANNLSDVANAATSFNNIKQQATESVTGVAEIATQAEVNTGTDDTKIITPDKLANSDLAGDVTTNNAKVTNATHTGEVTGATALTVDKTAITNKTNVSAAVGDSVLISDTSDTDNLKKATIQSIIDLAGGGTTYVLNWQTNSWNPADSTTYWFCPAQDIAASTATNGNRRQKMPVAASEFRLNIGIAANGSTEAGTWKIRNHTQSTEASFSPTHSFTSGGQANAYNGTATLSCNAGDYVELKFTAPVWTTNPTTVRMFAIVTFEAD